MSSYEEAGGSEEIQRESAMATKYATVELLVPVDLYLSSGVHIGTYFSNKQLEKFIYRVRPDGLYILDVRKIDERIRVAAKFIATFEPSSVVAVGGRQYSFKPVEMFAKLTGGKAVLGRFMPGTFTNPRFSGYIEPEVVIISDPRVDTQALTEAMEIGVPVVAFVSTDARISGIDLVIPGNNKGRKSLALLYYLLTRQVLRERGQLGATQELPVPLEEFEAKVVI
ncbi:30S ribosomal protein S2 [Desulfurococcaceae archaeon AG1]|jgi:small subunit ribosomal protein S2|nr:MAG: 30S ribosomal protein S2 [Desulfurococcaceae archaeon]GAY24865.1 30S ribosomal protein S2 [Desulfurococcaceae archaeon AG1]